MCVKRDTKRRRGTDDLNKKKDEDYNNDNDDIDTTAYVINTINRSNEENYGDG